MTILELPQDLKARYAELMLQQEIIQGQTNQVKQQIIEALNKPPEPKIEESPK